MCFGGKKAPKSIGVQGEHFHLGCFVFDPFHGCNATTTDPMKDLKAPGGSIDEGLSGGVIGSRIGRLTYAYIADLR